LNLRGNPSVNIPFEIFNLSKLRFLYLSSKKLTVVPKDIENLKELEELDFSDNKLTILRLEIKKCSLLFPVFLL